MYKAKKLSEIETLGLMRVGRHGPVYVKIEPNIIVYVCESRAYDARGEDAIPPIETVMAGTFLVFLQDAPGMYSCGKFPNAEKISSEYLKKLFQQMLGKRDPKTLIEIQELQRKK